MAEESVRLANNAIKVALESVAQADAQVNEISQDLNQWKKSNPGYLYNEKLKSEYDDKKQDLKEANERLKEANERLKEARKELKEANERLDKARAYHLQLISGSKRQRTDADVEVVPFENIPEININEGNYLKLPAAFLEKCGFQSDGDVMLYFRDEVRDLWNFLQNQVIANSRKGYIVGPPGTGKSMSTLSFVAQLDPNEWDVIWVHFSESTISCLALGSKKYWKTNYDSKYILPRIVGKKRLICLDGYKATENHKAFLVYIGSSLTIDERLLLCSSMATLGKFNREDAEWEKYSVFYMYSWTQDDYLAAIADPTFYHTIASKLDETSITEVNDNADHDEEGLSEEEKKKHALDLKFYYAGGSCRFMFKYTTIEVIQLLKDGVESAANKSDLVKYCGGSMHIDAINRLYGMTRNERKNARFPVSSYAASLFAEECGEDTIAQLVTRLNASKNPSLDGHLFEWLFLASVPKRSVKLFADNKDKDDLPQANVLRFDPKKRFKIVENTKIKGNQSWLQPIAWNQGGYDAVYFDKDKGEVIFIQVTRSDKHDFKMRYFYEVLYKLRMAGMEIKNVVVYFVTKPDQYINFKIGNIEDRGVLSLFDARWTTPEEKHVFVRAFERAPVSS